MPFILKFSGRNPGILRHLGLDPQPRPPPDVGRSVDLDVEAVETCARHASEYVEDWDPGL